MPQQAPLAPRRVCILKEVNTGSQSSIPVVSQHGSQSSLASGVGGVKPKQVPKTVKMPVSGCYETEADVTRAGLGPIGPPKQVPLPTHLPAELL